MYIRLVARGIIKGSKRPFFAHTVPFFGHIARLYSLKKPSYGQKMTLFSPLADPAQQVYWTCCAGSARGHLNPSTIPLTTSLVTTARQIYSVVLYLVGGHTFQTGFRAYFIIYLTQSWS